jgi:hypothetical protein
MMTNRIALPLLALVMAAGCSRGDASDPVSPGRGPAIREADSQALSEPLPRHGALHLTKECSDYTRLAGGYCTITSSNIAEIEVGSKFIYARDLGLTSLDSDLILDPPGPGNNAAFGHVVLDLAAAQGTVTFSGGTGRFTHFKASLAITRIGAPALRTWSLDGSYTFSPTD